VVGQRYDGPLAETSRRRELDAHPIGEAASIYHIGRSDAEAPAPAAAQQRQLEAATAEATTVQVDDEPTAGPSTLQKIGSIFAASTRKPAAHEFPASVPYEGALSELSKRPEHDSAPLEAHVTAYHHGVSDLVAPLTKQRPPTTSHPSAASSEFPPVEDRPYDGPLDELRRLSELGSVPLGSSVAAYHSGRSEQPAAVAAAQQQQHTTTDSVAAEEALGTKGRPAEAQHPPKDSGGVSTTLTRITGLFKKSAAHDDFPRSEHFAGELEAMHRAPDLPGQDLDQWVSAYHHGRSGDLLQQQPQVGGGALVSPAAPPLLSGYPAPGPAYEGPLNAMERSSESEAIPLPTRVTQYHPGRSDDQPEATTQRPPAKDLAPASADSKAAVPPKETAIRRLTSIFAAQHPHEHFPRSDPYDGPLVALSPSSDLVELRIDSHVAVYHATGRSDLPATELPATPSDAEHERKQEGLGRLASLFSAKKVYHF